MELISNEVKKISKIFILFCAFILFFLVTPAVFAAPSISGVSGTTSQGNTITITGTNFGVKSPAAPIRWETWESGVLGQTVSTAGYWTTLTNPPTFSSDYLRHAFSGKSSKHYFTRGMGQSISGSAFWKGNLNFGDDITGGKIFMSSWTRWKDPTVIDYGAQNTCQIKFFRIDSTQPGGDTPTIMNGSWYYPDKSPGNWYNMVREDATYQHGLGHYRYNDSQWNHVAVQIYTGTRGNSNGSIKNWDNGNQISSISNALFYINGYTKEFQMATFQFFMGNCYQAYTTMYTDDIYLDNTWARIEIGNASTYDGSSHREMLIPQTWGSSQVTATFNQGSFANGSQAYIFVVDADGNASPGRAITINGTPPPTCASFSYSAWSTCQSNNTQSRTITSSSPSGCTGGSPITYQSCTYMPPAQSCGDQTCGSGETCSTCAADCGTCPTPSVVWENHSITNQTGSFTAEFDAKPTQANSDAIVGMSNGTADAYTDLAPIFRFNDQNQIDARNGSAYAAQTVLSYVPNASYHVKMDINVPNRTYSAYVTPQGGAQTTIAQNYAFRTEQSTIANINNWAKATSGGAETTNFTVNTAPIVKTYTLSDFTNLVTDWLKSMTGSPADINLDNKVNSRDLGIMMSNWTF